MLVLARPPTRDSPRNSEDSERSNETSPAGPGVRFTTCTSNSETPYVFTKLPPSRKTFQYRERNKTQLKHKFRIHLTKTNSRILQLPVRKQLLLTFSYHDQTNFLLSTQEVGHACRFCNVGGFAGCSSCGDCGVRQSLWYPIRDDYVTADDPCLASIQRGLVDSVASCCGSSSSASSVVPSTELLRDERRPEPTPVHLRPRR